MLIHDIKQVIVLIEVTGIKRKYFLLRQGGIGFIHYPHRLGFILKGSKVMGTIEELHYDKTIWDAMTKEQRDKAVELRKAKGSQQAEKTATTSGSNPPCLRCQTR